MSEDTCTRMRALLNDSFLNAYGRRLEDTLKERGAELWIVGIDAIKNKLTDVCGRIGAQHMAVLNVKGAPDNDAGFMADTQKVFPEIGKTVDVFLLNVQNFAKSDDALVPLVVHELAHYLEQIGEKPNPTEADKGNAAAMFIGLKKNLLPTHSREWAQLLAMGARKMVEGKRSSFTTIKAFLEAAVPEYDRNGDISVRE